MEPAITVTGANLKALTHPLRVQVLGLLRTYGPATATTLAQRLGLTSGALSYHLRQLERYGFIAEDTERGNDRDRWWRAVHRSTEFDAQGLDPAAAEAGDAYEQGIITAITRSLSQAQADRAGWPAEWRKVFNLSDVLLELTPAEAERLEQDLCPARLLSAAGPRAWTTPRRLVGEHPVPDRARRTHRDRDRPVRPRPGRRGRRMTPRRPIVGLLATLGIATVGLRVSAIAIPWFVLTSSGSAVQTGLVVAAELGPYVLAKAVGGPLVDRLGQRRVSIVADVLSAGLFALIPLLHHLGALPLPVLLVIVAIAGALRGPGDAAKHTMAPLVATAAGTPLTRVTGLLAAIERSAGLVAPGLAALLITAFGPPATVLVTAICFGISALVVLGCIPASIAGPRPARYRAGDLSGAAAGGVAVPGP